MTSLYSLFWLIVAVVAQVLLFNHLQLFGGVILVYVIALLKLPVEMNRNIQIIIGFICGLIIDIFSNTLGMHTMTAVTMMWLRMPILHLFINAEDVKIGVPGNSLLGMPSYIRFALTQIAVHCFLLYFIESFSLNNIFVTLSKALISLIITFVATLSIEFTTLKK